MKKYKCAKCKKELKCNCFIVDDLEYMDEQGHFESGMIPFCSFKCLDEFNKKDEICESCEYKNHNFDCEIQGNLDRNYVKTLQDEIKKLNTQVSDREHYWHNRVEKVCGHRRIVKTQDVFKEDHNWLCLECSNYFKDKPKIKRIIKRE